jgi:MobA/MobL family
LDVEARMVTKSLPTFKHTSIGAKTHKAGTSTAHLSYIMRSDAMTKFQAENMPKGERGTRVFFDRLWDKAGMPDNARIADKLMIALPVELSSEQCYELVESFMHALGQSRIAWCAAHHDSGEDAHNPHAHILFKDADISTGRKVIGTTTSARDVREAKENGWKVPPRMTTADMRKQWCEHLNHYMERTGIDIRYDPRTLNEQGIDRDPQIHVGPKAQALNDKNYDFSSDDRIRGGRSIPYTLFDHDSRADHNAHIIEANRHKEQQNGRASPNGYMHPAVREDQEKRTLREAQRSARQTMYRDQQRDRDALRKTHDLQRLEHQKWTRRLYAGARQKAFDTTRKEFAERWRTVRGIESRKERETTEAALKREQKKSYALEAGREVDRCRPEKDLAWKVMLAQQEQERSDLRTKHREETIALARQHIAERLGVHEKWRAFHLDRQAAKVDAQLTMKQGMAPWQKAALAAIRLHARTGQAGASQGKVPLFANPREAAKAYFEIARDEDTNKLALRNTLNDGRRKNLERAEAFEKTRADRLRGSNGRADGNRKPAPRQIIMPGILDAKERSSKGLQKRLREIDPQTQIRQAAASGQPLSAEQRANAPPEVKDQLAREDKKSQQRSDLAGGNTSRKGQDKGNEGRSGGGRGR